MTNLANPNHKKAWLNLILNFCFIVAILDCSSNEIKKPKISSIPQEDKLVVAVTRTEPGAGGTQEEADLARDYLEEDFSGFEEYQLIDRASLNNALEELKFGKSGLVDESTAGRLGKFLGAKYLVYSKLSKIGGIYVITGKLVEVETAKIKKSSTGRSSSLEKLDGAAKGCARRLTGRIE